MTPTNGDEVVTRPRLADLHLDPLNPRFVEYLGVKATEPQIVNYLAETVGLNDLLSSMSRGGYFQQGPIVAVEEAGRTVVVEGNRRLATAIILTGDPRGLGQRIRAQQYPVSPDAMTSLERLPVMLATSRAAVLPYLGIAHIVGNKKWDSFAKAHWAADAIDHGHFGGDIQDIANRIGDEHQTLARLVEAFRIVKQLQSAGLFDPLQVRKRGRGTAPFPFSWLYTALGYEAVRAWLELAGRDSVSTAKSREPVSRDRIPYAEELLIWLYGKEGHREAAIGESRDIPELAAALSEPRRVNLLRAGRSAMEAKAETQPAERKINEALTQAEEQLKRAVGYVAAELPALDELQRAEVAASVRRIKNLVLSLERAVRAVDSVAESDVQ